MTERERIREDGSHGGVVYESPTDVMMVSEPLPASVPYPPAAPPLVLIPTDRVRWSAIIAGVFAVLVTLSLLSVLGMSIGISSFDPNNPARYYGLSMDMLGGIGALIAFGVGGWLAARSAAVTGYSNGVLNAVMVWIVTMLLLLYVLGGSTGSLLSAFGGTTGRAPQLGPAPSVAQAAGDAFSNLAIVEQIQYLAYTAAWGTPLALLAGFVGAFLGGLLGARRTPDLRVVAG